MHQASFTHSIGQTFIIDLIQILSLKFYVC